VRGFTKLKTQTEVRKTGLTTAATGVSHEEEVQGLRRKSKEGGGRIKKRKNRTKRTGEVDQGNEKPD